MSWVSILKGLPKPDAIVGMLSQDAGLELLVSQANGDNKKNIIGVRNKAKELASGKGITEGLDEKTVQSNAEKLVTKLEKIIADSNSKTQPKKPTLEDKLNTIIENKDKKGLVALVGNKAYRNMPSKTRKEKVSLLKKNKSAILDFIDMNDKDLFYYVTNEFSLVASKPISDDDWDDKVSNIRSQLSDTEINIDVTDGIRLTFPDKTSVSDMKLVLEVSQIKGKAEKKKDLIIFKKSGKFSKSPLLELYNDSEIPLQIKTKVKDAEKKNYTNTVSSPEHALAYLEMTISRGYKKGMRFTPKPKIQQGNAKVTKNANTLLLGGETPSLSSSLRSLFKTSTFDLGKLMQQGSVESDIRYNSPRLLAVLEGEEPVAIGGVGKSEITKLQEIYNNSRRNLTAFIKKLRGKPLSDFTKLNNALIQTKPNLFTEEEKTFMEGLSGVNPRAIPSRLMEYYNAETIDERLPVLLEGILRTSSPFKEITGGYKFMTPAGMKHQDMRDLVHGLKILRQADEVQDMSVSLEQTLQDYTTGYKPPVSGTPTPSGMIHYLYILDFYYARTPFRSVAAKFKRGESSSEELIKSAKDNFSQIISSFVDSVKIKVDDILENKEEYQDSLSLGNESKAYLLFDKLEEKGLIGGN
tara:strand:+ start:1930 stop:3840 length:1911 start_codon:yes stop_codon:yes gene_type:complete